MIGAVRRQSADVRLTKRHRPTSLATVGWLSPGVLSSVGRILAPQTPVKSTDCQSIGLNNILFSIFHIYIA